MKTLDEEKRDAINEKLENLRAVAAYYTMRKQIITDKIYRTHYDDELTMDVSKAFTDRILSMNKPYIVQTMGDILNEEEIDALDKRLNCIKGVLSKLSDKYQEAKWDAGKKQLSYSGFFADDEYRAIYALMGTATNAGKYRLEIEHLSKFLPENVVATPLKDMLEDREDYLTEKGIKG